MAPTTTLLLTDITGESIGVVIVVATDSEAADLYTGMEGVPELVGTTYIAGVIDCKSINTYLSHYDNTIHR